jgi:acetylornithine/succinyldiaminopimelate/putrescine aminotransferase/predicted amino acid dehydrogenase
MQRKQEAQKSYMELKLYVTELDGHEQMAIHRDWRYRLINLSATIAASSERKDWFLHMLMQEHDLLGLINLVHDFNTKQLELKPKVAHLTSSYHGKTLGSLSITANEKFKTPFYVDTESSVALSPFWQESELANLFALESFDIIDMGVHQIGLYLGTKKHSKICGIFVEPIQGEAGVIEISSNFLALLKKYSLKEQFLLVFDEIQSGMFRTGLMAAAHHHHITADIYCFSKALGGGLAKIGATCIIARKYIDEFGMLHSSTFAEDGYSSAVAIKALSIVQSLPLQSSAMKMALRLKQELLDLQDMYPDVIREVRGRGLMLAIEFDPKTAETSFDFRVFSESHMLGYLIASALLHNESLRLTPSLSNAMTLRIQPTLFMSGSEIQFLKTGLLNLCSAIRLKNFSYFFQHLYPQSQIEQVEGEIVQAEYKPGKNPLAVFLCHLIDGDHIKSISPSFQKLENSALDEKLALLKGPTCFSIYHAQTLKDSTGREIDVILMGIPVTSQQLKKDYLSKERSALIAKVQEAIIESKKLGATTVGLGQFTSIVSGNGLYLDPMGLNLTTGNAYTTHLAIAAALKIADDKKLNLESATACLIGAAGNIVSVCSMLMADKVKKIILIHHTALEKSNKLIATLKSILQESYRSQATSAFNEFIKQELDIETLNSTELLLQWTQKSSTKEFLEITSDLTKLIEADIVITGASAGTGFLKADDFKQNAIIVDLAVPANIKPEALEHLKSTRPDLSYTLGGIARLPGEQSVSSPIFPLNENESFACMAETFALAMDDAKGITNIGQVTKEMVSFSAEVCQRAGFSLSKSKSSHSL